MATKATRRRPLAGALVALVLIACGAPGTSRVAAAQSQSLFVSVTDADGFPVTDITREEVVVEFDGEPCETLSFEPIDWPVRVTVFVDNGMASGPALDHMREGLRLFVDALPPDVEVAIATIGGRPQFWARHTTDREELMDAIGVIVMDPNEEVTFLDALYEEVERLHEDEADQYFPVIVMVATNGPEGSTRVRILPYTEMIVRLYANKAIVHTRMFTVTSATGVNQDGAQMRWARDIGNMTGGSYQGLSSPDGYRVLLPQLAEDLARKHRLVSNQYRVTYALPDGAFNQWKIKVLSTRAGVKMVTTLDGNVR